jgi:DNA/RNA-binding domain of Phe-tRNA-synthetase-like protein
MSGFGYDAAVIERFPATVGGIVHAIGLTNGPSGDALRSIYQAEQESVRAQIGDTPLSEFPTLAAWRRTFSAFGVKPTQYRSAPEALLRRLIKQGDIPSINRLVDIANIVSIRHRLPVAVFDQVAVTGSTTVRFATGSEHFTDLGSGSESPPEPGEVIFVDDADLVSARRWCWRQSAQSAAGPGTTEAVITIEAQHEGGQDAVARAMTSLKSLLSEYQPVAVIRSDVLSAGHTSVDF